MEIWQPHYELETTRNSTEDFSYLLVGLLSATLHMLLWLQI